MLHPSSAESLTFTMSHPLYNTSTSGRQSCTQSQHEPHADQPRKNPHEVFPGFRLRSSLSSSGALSSTPASFDGAISPQLSLPVSFRPGQNPAVCDKHTERSVDLLVWSYKEVGHQSVDQDTHFTNIQRREISTLSRSSSVFQGHKHSDVDNGNSSMDWLLICKRDAKEDTSSVHSSSGLSAFDSNRRTLCSEQEGDVASVPCVDSNEHSAPDRSAPSSESSQPRYTAESAANILLEFGLDKEDLADLDSYPEDEVTPENLPLILRQICIQKQKRAAGGSSEAHPTTGVSLKDSLISSERSVMKRNKKPRRVLKHKKVKRHSDKSTIVKDRIGKTSRGKSGRNGGTLLLNNQSLSGCSKKPPQKALTEVKTSSSDSVTSLRSKKSSVIRPGSDPTKRVHVQLKQKDKVSKPHKSKVSKSKSSKEPESGRLSTSEPLKSSTERISRPGLKNPNRKQSRTQDKRETGVKVRKHQKLTKTASKVGKDVQCQVSSTKQAFIKRTAVKEAVLTGLPTVSMINDYAAATPRIFPHTCSLCNKECKNMQDWLSHQNTSFHLESCRLLRKQFPKWDGEIYSVLSAQRRTAELLPSTPQTSQHCYQKTRDESRSRSQSPLSHRGSEGRRDKPGGAFRSSSPERRRSWSSRSSSSSPGSRRRLKGQRWGSRSRSQSRSPQRRCSSKDRRDRFSSRSGSPHSFRDTHRSPSRSRSPRYDRTSTSLYPSRSRSHERQPPSSRRDEKWSPPRRSFERQDSPKRSEEKRTSPRLSSERRLSSETPVSQRKTSSSLEILSKKLLETSGLQTDLEMVVKTLTPVLLAELEKMKSSSSSSSSSFNTEKLELAPKSLKTKSKEFSSVRLETAAPQETSPSSNKLKKPAERNSGLVYQDRVVGIRKKKTFKVKHKVETEAKQDCPGSPSAETKPTAAAALTELSITGTCSSDPVAFPPLGEQIEKCLDSKDLWPVDPRLSQPSTKILLITNLPKYYDGCYTEEDFVVLLHPFGFVRGASIYVIPQKQMAVALMPDMKKVKAAISTSMDGIYFRGSKLSFQVLKRHVDMSPFGFYKTLTQQLHSEETDAEGSTIYIQNISASEASELRKAVGNIGSIKNYVALLNKVFIEFESVRDADRIGVWYSFMKQGRNYKVKRMKVPEGSLTALAPKLAVKALPDCRDIVAGAKIPMAEYGIPQGSVPPFWVTMTTCPYVFPTVSPWFNIPNFLTVKGPDDIEKARAQGSAFSTVMLTGFCEKRWDYREIARLVWRYFPQEHLQSLSFHLLVLPMQRRAFVYFVNWDSCCSFVIDHLTNPVSAQGFPLSIHFVLEDMHPGFSEEVVYRNLMKWSNAHVLEPESLKERLLCVEVSAIDTNFVISVMKLVASVASFVNFLPLADRIYVEMAEASGVTQVVNRHLKGCLSKSRTLKNVKKIRSLNLQQLDVGVTCSNSEVDSRAGGADGDMDQSVERTETQSAGPEHDEMLPEKGSQVLKGVETKVSFLLPDGFEILDSVDSETETESNRQISEIPIDGVSKTGNGPIQEKEKTNRVFDGSTRTSYTEEDEKSPDKQNEACESSETHGEDSTTEEEQKIKKDRQDEEETTTCDSTSVDLQQLAEGSGPGERERTTRTTVKDINTPTTKSGSDTENTDSIKSEITLTLNDKNNNRSDEEEAEKTCRYDDDTDETGEVRETKEEEDKTTRTTTRTRGPTRKTSEGEEPSPETEIRKEDKPREEEKMEEERESLKPEVSSDVIEAGSTEEDKPEEEEAEKTKTSAKRKLHDSTEENLVTSGEVLKAEEENEVTTPRTRGRPRKKPRKAPVRKSTRGKRVSAEDKREEEEEEGDNKAGDKVVGKRRKVFVGPEAKRTRRSGVHADVSVQLFNPDSSCGSEFIVRKLGLFCSVCSLFYVCEKTEEDLHCSSKTHYDNLQKHYQKTAVKRRSSRMKT